MPAKKKPERSEAQKAAEREYRARRVQVNLRYTPEEAALIDAVAGGDRPAWIKAVSLKAAKRRAK